MKKSRVFTLGVACFFCAVTALGVIPLSGINNGVSVPAGGATASSNSANLAGAAQLGDSAANQAIQLDPATDETIFTTESGFEIKSHTVAGNTLANSKVQYFTLGSYNGTALNWIILAGSTQMTETSTPAGSAINADSSKQTLSMMTTSNLSANQILVISEKVIPISSYSFSVTAKTGTTTGSLPGSTSFGTGWQYEESAGANCVYYTCLLCDAVSEYYSSYTGNYSAHSSTINGWFTGSSLGLSSYCGNKIVKNSNFNSSYYGFALTNSQLTTYLPTSLRAAKDTSGTARSYWCGDNIVATIDTSSVDYTITYATYRANYYPTGTATCTWFAGYVNTSGSNVTSLHIATGTIGNTNTARYCSYDSDRTYCYRYIYVPTCTFSSSGTTSITAYYRPAMVVDLSKF